MTNSVQQTTGLSPYPYFATYIIPLLSLLSLYLGGINLLLTPAFTFGLIPVLELLVGADGYNPSKEECKLLEKMLGFRLVTWLWVPMQYVVLFASAKAFSDLYATEGLQDVTSLLQYLGIALTCALNTGGLGFTIAHELIHKPSAMEQTFGKMILLGSSYMHFYIEHIQGHHKRVSTPHDPASSRLGENVFQFLPRTVVGSYLSAWELESRRLAKSGFSFYSWRNQMLWFLVLPIAFCRFLTWLYGPEAGIFFILQSAMAITLLEVINFIEHYGLERKEVQTSAAKEYERVTPFHSWNADHRITNYFLFKLQRHSDHHTFPGRRYQTLRSWNFSPQMPTGYAGMTLMALIPPVWHYVMDPKVHEIRKIADTITAKEVEQMMQE